MKFLSIKILMSFLLLSAISFNTFAQVELSTITENDIQKSWQNFFKDESETINKFNTYPWQELAELNIFAAKTWDMMRACEGTSKEDIERAKEKYKTNEVFCNPEINKNLQQLHDSTYGALISSYIHIPDHKSPQRQTYAQEEQHWPFPQIHPLFSQILLEMLSTAARFRRYEPAYYSTFSSRITKAINNPESVDSDQLSTVRIHINVELILKFGPKESCSEWGLWPEKSYALTKHLFFAISYFYGTALHDVYTQNTCNINKTTYKQPYVDYELNYKFPYFFRSIAHQYGYKTNLTQSCYIDLCFSEDPAVPKEVYNSLKERAPFPGRVRMEGEK